MTLTTVAFVLVCPTLRVRRMLTRPKMATCKQAALLRAQMAECLRHRAILHLPNYSSSNIRARMAAWKVHTRLALSPTFRTLLNSQDQRILSGGILDFIPRHLAWEVCVILPKIDPRGQLTVTAGSVQNLSSENNVLSRAEWIIDDTCVVPPWPWKGKKSKFCHLKKLYHWQEKCLQRFSQIRTIKFFATRDFDIGFCNPNNFPL